MSMPIKIPDELRLALKSARHIAVLTGAGSSAESGVPTFRQAQSGLWSRYDPQQLATPEAFRQNPGLIWDWYTWRRSLVTKAMPNPGDYALAQMAELVPEFTLITQNVDGLHQEAGNPVVIELHGNIMRTKCSDCGMIASEYDDKDPGPPRCSTCHGFLRPDVVWFGENLPQEALSSAYAASRKCDIFLSIGTSSVVHPAATLPIEAMRRGMLTIEVNPEQTPLTSSMTFVLVGPSGTILPTLVSSTWPE